MWTQGAAHRRHLHHWRDIGCLHPKSRRCGRHGLRCCVPGQDPPTQDRMTKKLPQPQGQRRVSHLPFPPTLSRSQWPRPLLMPGDGRRDITAHKCHAPADTSPCRSRPHIFYMSAPAPTHEAGGRDLHGEEPAGTFYREHRTMHSTPHRSPRTAPALRCRTRLAALRSAAAPATATGGGGVPVIFPK